MNNDEVVNTKGKCKMKRLHKVISQISPIDLRLTEKVSKHIDQLTKPIGALGRIEQLAIQLAGITGNERPTVQSPAIVVAAGDHGIVAEGVSAFPQEVTKQMIHNFIQGKAAINVFARQIGATVQVVDVGVNGEITNDFVIHKKVKHGTNNFLNEDAMNETEAIAAIEVGIEVAEQLIEKGHQLLITGEMGIGNTTPSSALIAAFTGEQVGNVVGNGTGVEDEGKMHKINVIEKALRLRAVDRFQPLETFRKIGGLEIGALTGVILKGAAAKVPVIVDGFISTAAALVAYEICPTIKDYLIISHQSVEPGHQAVFQYLDKKPLLSLDLRLGEGTGAALAYPLVDAACRIMTEMATFEELGITQAQNVKK